MTAVIEELNEQMEAKKSNAASEEDLINTQKEVKGIK